MGKRNSHRKKGAAMLDMEDDDDNSSVSSSMTIRSDRFSVMEIEEEVEVDDDSLLNEALDALYEKRGSTRENALSSIIVAFNNSLHHQFMEKNFVTLLHQCLNSFKRGSTKETCLASHMIGLLALSVGFGDNAGEILEESMSPLTQALNKSASETVKIALLKCLAIITFVGGSEPEQTERSMQLMWQVVHPKLKANNVQLDTKTSGATLSAMVGAWSLLVTTIDVGWNKVNNSKDWEESLIYLSSLLDKEDRIVRIAAGEALALIFEIGGSYGTSQQGLKAKIMNRVRSLSAEAGGKGCANKKDLTNQRNRFHEIVEYFENGSCPEVSVKIGGDSLLQTSTWSELIQLNFVKHFLGEGFVKHMQENEFLHEVFGFTPPKKYEHRLSSSEKRMFKSPNSALNKARTRHLNKQRMLSEGKKIGHFSVSCGDEEEA
ncbi:hypothetical protein F8388_010927 [Cannabis sativa]|uniref:Interferon-related developmental regulator 1 n=1 Tax=Cannabis sativa TaxID=3483 RepID=A0A7J6EE22_CANSA|nr:hypothetical protein F8388_010927 [Cannabis sativa]KAF4396128.1 hypothetical protein G4B88_020765 [Cannabis sativa]